MTSGIFEQYSIQTIWVNRETRQRRTLTKIEELADSIHKCGLIHPLTITREGELICGERRWEALKMLGWDKAPVQFVEDLSELELQLLELDENIKRLDIEWQDEVAAAGKYHALRLASESNWSVQLSADALGVSRRQLDRKLLVNRAVEQGNESIATAPKFSVAYGIASRAAERKQASIIEHVEELTDLTNVPQEIKEAGGLEEFAREIICPLENADFNTWAKKYKGAKINFLHCDFPYGVNADKHKQGAAAAMGGYEDGFAVYEKLIKTLAAFTKKNVAESAHLMFWYSMDYHDYTQKALEKMGWTVNPFPMVWHKSDNSGILPDPNRGPRRTYETAFFCSRGDRKIVRAVANSHAAPTTKEIHMSEKPKGMLKHFFRMFVDENTIMLDPTCGSANAVYVAEEIGADSVIGLERDKEFYTLAKGQWDE